MLTREAVDTAFALCLRRPVESEATYAFFTSLASLDEVYATLFDAPEFRGRLAPAPADYAVEPQSIETAATPDALARMVAHVEATWSALGAAEPHWSVITDPRFKAADLEANAALFRETGRVDEARLAAAAARAGLDLAQRRSCLELGCGTGRVTEWLAQRFSRVIAADISAAHLAVARTTLGTAPGVVWRHLQTLGDLAALPAYDMLYCRIVLQHNPPPVIAAILRQVLTSLAPGGAGFIQVPVWIPGYRFSVADYLAGLHAGPMEMHAIPQHALLAILHDCGCRVRELREDPLGPQFGGISNTVLLEKAMA